MRSAGQTINPSLSALCTGMPSVAVGIGTNAQELYPASAVEDANFCDAADPRLLTALMEPQHGLPTTPFAANLAHVQMKGDAAATAAAPASLALARYEGIEGIDPDILGNLIETATVEGFIMGGRLFSNLDEATNISLPLAKALDLISLKALTSNDTVEVLIGAGTMSAISCIIGIFVYLAGIIPLAAAIATPTVVFSLLYFTPKWFATRQEAAKAAQKHPRFSKAGMTHWLNELEKAGKKYVNDRDRIGNLQLFNSMLESGSKVHDPEGKRDYDYPSLIGPKVLARFAKMASRTPLGVHLVMELAKRNRIAASRGFISAIEIEWPYDRTPSGQVSFERVSWLARNGNRSILQWLAGKLDRNRSYLYEFQRLEEDVGIEGLEEFIAGVEVEWGKRALESEDIESDVAWMLKHGNRSIVRWLVDWAAAGDGEANKKAMDILGELKLVARIQSKSSSTGVRIADPHASEVEEAEDEMPLTDESNGAAATTR